VTVLALVAVAALLAANLVLLEGERDGRRGVISDPGSATPQPSSAISWTTTPVRFEADALRLQLGEVLLTGQGDVEVRGYGDLVGERSLDASWRELGAERSLSWTLTSDGSEWWISRLVAGDGSSDDGEIVFDPADLAAIGRTPLSATLTADVRLVGAADADSAVSGPIELEIDRLRLTAFEPGTGADRSTAVIADVTVTGDTVGAGVLRLVDDGTSHALDAIGHVAVTPNGRMWVATATQLYELGREGGLRTVDGGPPTIAALEAGADDRLLVPAGDGGWRISDGGTWSDPVRIGSDVFGEVVLAADGALWGATLEDGGGIGRLDGDGLTVYPYAQVFPAVAQLDPDGVVPIGSIMALPDGSVWGATGTGGSVSRFDGERWQESRPLGTPAEGQRIGDLAANTGGDVWALLEDAAGHYVGRFDGADWILFDWGSVLGDAATSVRPGMIGGGFPDEIATVTADGAVVIPLLDGGGDVGPALLHFDGSSRSLLPFDQTLDVAPLPDGRLLGAGWGGLYLLDPSAWLVVGDGQQ
jgi:hypothetical protein